MLGYLYGKGFGSKIAIFEPTPFPYKYPNILYPVILRTYPPMKLKQSVPKRRHIKFRRRGITQKKTYNVQNKAKVWNQETSASLHILWNDDNTHHTDKGKSLPQQAELALGVPGRLKPQIFLTFDTTRVVRRHPYAPAAFIPGEIPHF